MPYTGSLFLGMNTFATLDVVIPDNGISCATVGELAKNLEATRGSRGFRPRYRLCLHRRILDGPTLCLTIVFEDRFRLNVPLVHVQ
jgi:hypothetical protein